MPFGDEGHEGLQARVVKVFAEEENHLEAGRDATDQRAAEALDAAWAQVVESKEELLELGQRAGGEDSGGIWWDPVGSEWDPVGSEWEHLVGSEWDLVGSSGIWWDPVGSEWVASV
jgi:hypothetical protein